MARTAVVVHNVITLRTLVIPVRKEMGFCDCGQCWRRGEGVWSAVSCGALAFPSGLIRIRAKSSILRKMSTRSIR